MDRQLKPTPTTCPERACSVARVFDRIGDGWSFLVLRAAFFGETRFEGFLKALQAPRAQVAASLRRLQAAGVLTHRPAAQGPRYALTDSGLAFYPICVGLMDWGDRYARPAASGSAEPAPLRLRWRDAPDSAPDITPRWVCAACQRGLDARDCLWHDGPGAGQQLRPAGRRRSPDSRLYARAQPCSVARALAMVGDVWSFLILREAFFRTRHFEDFVSRLGVARNVLSARLERLVTAGVLTRASDSQDGRRLSYRLAPPGLALYPVIVALMAWGDHWLTADGQAPLWLVHQPCGLPLLAQLIDAHTGRPLDALYIVARPGLRAGA